MSKVSDCCPDCRYFYGYDGVGELWTGCSMYRDFKGTKTNCESFEKKVTRADLLHKIQSLEKENEQLKQELRCMNELLKSYRKTIKHDAELLADATRNGYLPPLDDFVKR